MEIVSMRISMGMMAKPSAWRPLFAARLFVNPQIARVFLQPTTSSILSPRLGSFGCFSTAKRVAAVKKSAFSKKAQSIGEGCKYPRPESVAWQMEIANTVQLIGIIEKPVEMKYTETGKACAWASLSFKPSKSQETTWFKLKFFEELAKIAAEHVKASDRVYVSGSLDFEKEDGEDNNLCTVPQVHVKALSFVERDHPFPQSEDVNVNASVETKEAEAKLSSEKRTTMDAASTEKLWQTFFSRPDEWWDKRENKKNPKGPDFKHKNNDEALWIESSKTPSWVKSRLNTLEERKHEEMQENDADGAVLKVETDKKTTMDATSTETLWQAFFTKPDEWWDNREKKKNPKAPDFKHKNKDEVLWIDSYKNPSWVKSRLNALEERKHEETQENDADGTVLKVQTDKKSTMDAASIEKLWQAFFVNPDEWWDNRKNKKNAKAPDFKHKDTGEALWIESFKNPSWVKSQLDKLEKRTKDSHQFTRSRESLSSFMDRDLTF